MWQETSHFRGYDSTLWDMKCNSTMCFWVYLKMEYRPPNYDHFDISQTRFDTFHFSENSKPAVKQLFPPKPWKNFMTYMILKSLFDTRPAMTRPWFPHPKSAKPDRVRKTQWQRRFCTLSRRLTAAGWSFSSLPLRTW